MSRAHDPLTLPARAGGLTLHFVTLRTRLLIGGAICLVIIGLTGLSLSLRYYLQQWDRLEGETYYPTPEEGLRAVTTPRYPDACRIEPKIIPNEIFPDMRLGMVEVWGRKDGRCDYPAETRGVRFIDRGFWFVRVKNGWAFLPMERYPQIYALGRLSWGLLSGGRGSDSSRETAR